MFPLKIDAVNQHTEHRLDGGQWLFHYSNIYIPTLLCIVMTIRMNISRVVLTIIPMLDADIGQTN